MILISKRENVPKRKAPQGLSYFVREFQLAKVVQHITQQQKQQKQKKKRTDNQFDLGRARNSSRHSTAPTGRISLRLKAHGVFFKKQNSRGVRKPQPIKGN